MLHKRKKKNGKRKEKPEGKKMASGISGILQKSQHAKSTDEILIPVSPDLKWEKELV